MITDICAFLPSWLLRFVNNGHLTPFSLVLTKFYLVDDLVKTVSPFFFFVFDIIKNKRKKKFSVVEGKLNQKKWETYCHFPICVLIPSISLRCQTPLSPPLPLQWHHHCYHCPQHSYHHYHHTIFDAGKAQGQGQSAGLVGPGHFLFSPQPTQPSHFAIGGHHVHHITFFNTVVTTPASKIYFFLKKSIRLDQVDKGNGIHIFFFMKKLNIISLSYKSFKS